MKARVDRKAFADALTIVAAAIPPRPNVAILAAVEIHASGDHIRLRATDWERTIWQTIPAEVGDEGTVYVSGHRMRSIVGAFAGADVDLALDDRVVHVVSGTSKFRTSTMNAAEFPAAPVLPERLGAVESSDLTDGLRRISHAKGGDDTTDVSGIIMTAATDGLWLLSTDRYVIGGTEIDYHGSDFHIRVRYDHVIDATKFGAGPIGIHADESNIAFTVGESGMMTRLIDATKYPDLHAYAARVSGETFVVSRDSLCDALRRTELILERNGSVQIDVTDGTALLTSREEGSDLAESVAVDTAADFHALVNPTYLRAALECIPQERVEFTMPPVGRAGAIGLVGIDDGYRSPDYHFVQSKRPLQETP